MKFDEVLEKIGKFGTYQKRVYFLLCLTCITVSFQMVISVFILGTPTHRCSLPSWQNDTYAIQSRDHGLAINSTIPYAGPGEDFRYSQCDIYVSNTTSGLPGIHGNKTVKCEKWTYDTSVFHSTMVTKLDLVCDQKQLKSHAQMVYMAGTLIGAIGFGLLSDIYGRKKIFFVGIVLQLSSGFAVAWAPEFYSFIILRLLNGCSNAGIFMNAFVMGVEFVGPSKRMWAGIVIEYFFALGLVLLAGIAYLIRDWQYLEIACSLPTALFLVYWWLIPESARWLLANNRKDEAEKILRHAADINKVTLPEKLFDEKDFTEKDQPNAKIWEIFTSPVLCTRSIVIFVNWLVVSMVYYGLSLNSGNLAGDLYLNFFLTGLVEFPAYTICLLLMDRLGRKALHCGSMLLGGIACICTVFPVLYASESLQGITVTLAMIGKLGAAAAFAVIYVFSSELFPTVVRNGAMGAASMFARVGGMMAPYIADSADYIGGNFGKALPLVIFGGSAVAAGLLSLMLPETLNQELPETMEDGENFGRKNNEHRMDLEGSSRNQTNGKFAYYNSCVSANDDAAVDGQSTHRF